VRDRAGNATTKTWSFEVMPDRVRRRPLPLSVTNYRDNAVVDAGGNLAIQGRRRRRSRTCACRSNRWPAWAACWA
jgi:hypothetical protein